MPNLPDNYLTQVADAIARSTSEWSDEIPTVSIDDNMTMWITLGNKTEAIDKDFWVFGLRKSILKSLNPHALSH